MPCLALAGPDVMTGILLPLALAGGAGDCSSAADGGTLIGADDQRQLNSAAAKLDTTSVEANALVDHESSPHD